MKQQDFWCHLYNKCFGENFFLKKLRIYSFVRHVVCYFANTCLVWKYKNKAFVQNVSEPHRQQEIIVSLTSFPARIDTIWLTLSTLLEQSLMPNRIILWLSKKQFTSKKCLPNSLLRLEKYGVDIKLVDGDIRSHKKFYYSFTQFSNELVVLVDDDIIYPSNMIKRLYDRWISLTGKRVICSYGNITQYSKEGQRTSYNDWPEITTTDTQYDLFFGSGGGTLIRPSDLYKDVLNKELFLKLTPFADDIWLNAMCRLGNVNIYRERFDYILPVRIKENSTLSSVNLTECKNDKQLNAIDSYYSKKNNIAPFSKVLPLDDN